MFHYSKFITSDVSDLTFISTAKFVRWLHLQIEWDSFEAKLSSSQPVVDHKPLSFTSLKRSIKLVWKQGNKDHSHFVRFFYFSFIIGFKHMAGRGSQDLRKLSGQFWASIRLETPCSQDNCMGESNTNFNLNSPCIEIPPYAHWDKRRICFVLQKSRNHTFKYWTVQNAPC